MAVLARGAGKQALTKVKGHATAEDVAEGTVQAVDKEGNDWADTYAERGAKQREGCRFGDVDFDLKLMLANWLHARQAKYIKLVHGIQKMMAAVIRAEQEERERRKKGA